MDGGLHGNDRGLPPYMELAAGLGHLKRVRDASSPNSLAARAFRRAWDGLASGDEPKKLALAVTADALAAIRLGGIDAGLMTACSVANSQVILRRAFDEVSLCIAPALRVRLRESLGCAIPVGVAPDFVEQLIRQPRAGATCPGKPRIILEPPENHGDHCLVVAVLGVVLSGHYGADPATVFIAGLAHHLHNATLPDSGFAGEILLGDELTPLVQRLFERALASLPIRLRDTLQVGLACIVDAHTPEGRAFHAADVIDRVLQMHHFAKVAGFSVTQALDELELVHTGPVQAFHHTVLDEAGLR